MHGFVYILSNAAMPSLFKVGYTTRMLRERINELSNSTGVPIKFEIEFFVEVDRAFELEQLLHRKLLRHRQGKEFFNCELKLAINLVKLAIVESGIALISSGGKSRIVFLTEEEIEGERKKLELQKKAAEEQAEKQAERKRKEAENRKWQMESAERLRIQYEAELRDARERRIAALTQQVTLIARPLDEMLHREYDRLNKFRTARGILSLVGVMSIVGLPVVGAIENNFSEEAIGRKIAKLLLADRAVILTHEVENIEILLNIINKTPLEELLVAVEKYTTVNKFTGNLQVSLIFQIQKYSRKTYVFRSLFSNLLDKLGVRHAVD